MRDPMTITKEELDDVAAEHGWSSQQLADGALRWIGPADQGFVGADPETLPVVRSHLMRASLITYFAEVCPACGAEGRRSTDEQEIAALDPGRVAIHAVQTVNAGPGPGDITFVVEHWLLFEHAAECPVRPEHVDHGPHLANP